MSVQSAMEFIRQARNDESLKNRIACAQSGRVLEAIARIGAEAGFEFSADELQSAFKHDWRMRWLYYSAQNQYEATTKLPECRQNAGSHPNL